MARPELINDIMNAKVESVNQTLDISKTFGNLMRAVIPSAETRAKIANVLSVGNITGLLSIGAVAGVTAAAAMNQFGGGLSAGESMLASVLITTGAGFVAKEVAQSVDELIESRKTLSGVDEHQSNDTFAVHYSPDAERRIASEVENEQQVKQKYVGYDMK